MLIKQPIGNQKAQDNYQMSWAFMLSEYTLYRLIEYSCHNNNSNQGKYIGTCYGNEDVLEAIFVIQTS